MVVYRPENIVNLYVWEQFKKNAPEFYNLYGPTSGGNSLVPFFPAPANNLPTAVIDNDLPYIIFDKFTRLRNSYKSFYPIKTDQMRYTIVGGTLYDVTKNQQDRYATTINLTSLIQSILDREDAAAQDINQFTANLPGYNDPRYPEMNRYYFHNISVYQSGYAESQQDVANFMEYNPTRDLIIRYDYHNKQYNE
jgi:hypothetical protein